MVQGRKWGSAQVSEGDALVRPNHSALSSIEWLQYKVHTTANFASSGANSGYNIGRVLDRPKEVTMSTTHTLVTADELFVMPDDGFRYELVRGELRRMPPAGSEHGAVIMNIGTLA